MSDESKVEETPVAKPPTVYHQLVMTDSQHTVLGLLFAFGGCVMDASQTKGLEQLSLALTSKKIARLIVSFRNADPAQFDADIEHLKRQLSPRDAT